MSMNYSQQQLSAMTKEQITEIHRQALTRKSELTVAKTKGGKNWTPEMQEELDEIAEMLVDIEEVLEQKKSEATVSTEAKAEDIYIPPTGTENMVHVSLFTGNRYDPKTGKEINKPYRQMFSFSEWQLFKNNYSNLGYTIASVLHNPYEDKK